VNLTIQLCRGRRGFPAISLALLLGVSAVCRASQPSLDADAHELATLANQSRAQAGLAPLQWDAALAAAAHAHALRMAAEGPIAHRYGGEPSLAERTSAAGAHFQLVEENIAIGDSSQQIHTLWMHSTEHRENLLNPRIDRVGAAVVAARGVLYAVADYSQAVAQLSLDEQEAEVAQQIVSAGLPIHPGDAARDQARLACASSGGVPSSAHLQPLFVMRWQSGSLAHVPAALVQKIRSGSYGSAAVGACKPHTSSDQEQAAFTAYRIAVLLY
jgi:hypothetical protein